MITVLAGGVGAARFLTGLVRVIAPDEITAVVNTGDDTVLHGLHVSPDLDTITYTLAGAVDPRTGWGLVGESWRAMDALDRYGATTWFRLGDQDLATHLYRTGRLAEGAPLSTVTREIVRSWGLDVTLLPVSDDPVRTMVTVVDEGEIGFQDYFVRRRHAVEVTSVRFAGAGSARPAPGVIEAIDQASAVVIAPSNPIVSLGPLLAVPGVREAIERRRPDTVAISPIVAGAAVKGPAARLMTELGHESSAVGVARLYSSLASALIIDEADAALAGAVTDTGIDCVVAPTIMATPELAADLARCAIGATR